MKTGTLCFSSCLTVLAAATLLGGTLLAAPAAPRTDVVLSDFDGSDYGAWKATGDAFGTGPSTGTLPGQQPISGFAGKGFVNSYLNGDTTTGTLTSPPFRIERKFINFLVGGGNFEGQTCVNLVIDGRTVRTATGRNSEELLSATWDVSAYAGKTAVIKIVDTATGGWGHINVDRIIQSDVRAAQEIVRQNMYSETYRPQFHFTPKINWTNDPNGLVYFNGEYHLFFQHNPTGINWGNMTWGHAVSKDLVHWTQLENAILPDSLGTIFSGSAVVDWDNTTGLAPAGKKAMVCIYTAAGSPFTQCIAFSTDGRTFTKYDKNPVMPHVAGENRDPKVIWHAPERKWVMALYLVGDTYALFESKDLKSWTKLHDVKFPGHGECPDFFPMAVDGVKTRQKWVFTAANGDYMIGTFDGKTFKPETEPIRADYGANYYAVQSYSDIPEKDGRRIQISWMNGGRYPDMPFNQQMSFPCEMRLRTFPEGLRICRTPVTEIKSIYGTKHSWKDTVVAPGKNLLKDVKGDLFDIQMQVEPGAAKEFGVTCSGESVTYDVEQKKLVCLGREAPVETTNGHINLRILVDRTSIEVFANDGKVVMTSCFLPPAGVSGLEMFATGGNARVVSMDVYELKSAWTAGKAKK